MVVQVYRPALRPSRPPTGIVSRRSPTTTLVVRDAAVPIVRRRVIVLAEQLGESPLKCILQRVHKPWIRQGLIGHLLEPNFYLWREHVLDFAKGFSQELIDGVNQELEARILWQRFEQDLRWVLF